MREARLIDTRPVALDEIDADPSGRLRPASAPAVETIVASIKKLGVMKDEVILRATPKAKQPFKLIAGLHRFEAARALGWETVPAKIFDCSPDWAREMEIDDNLANAELSALELAVFLTERKRLYIVAHPQTAQGAAGAVARWEDASDTMSFASMIAEKRGISKRHVERYVEIGEHLSPDATRLLAGTPIGFKDLKDLSRLPQDEQADIASKFRLHGLKSIAEAVRRTNGEPTPPPPAPEDAHYLKLMDAFGRAPTAARRRFLNQLWLEQPGLMAEEALRVKVGEA